MVYIFFNDLIIWITEKKPLNVLKIVSSRSIGKYMLSMMGISTESTRKDTIASRIKAG